MILGWLVGSFVLMTGAQCYVDPSGADPLQRGSFLKPLRRCRQVQTCVTDNTDVFGIPSTFTHGSFGHMGVS